MKRFLLVFKMLFLSPVTLILVFGILTLMLLSGCSSTNYADKQTVINNHEELVKIDQSICEKYRSKSSDTVFYGCSVGESSDFYLSRKKSILNAKTLIADKLSSAIIKNESQTIKEDAKGIVKTYDSDETNTVWETSLDKYEIEYQKTFKSRGQFLTFTVLKYKIS